MRIRPLGVPPEATGRSFVPKGKKGGDYWVWKHGSTYYWVCGPANGEKDTFDEAAEEARRWIRGDK